MGIRKSKMKGGARTWTEWRAINKDGGMHWETCSKDYMRYWVKEANRHVTFLDIEAGQVHFGPKDYWRLIKVRVTEVSH